MSEKRPPLRDDLAVPGFLKTNRRVAGQLSPQQRTMLIRKGNEFFNQGRTEEAKRIFLTTGYTDGLVRMGDYYLKRDEPLEAFRMYWLAPDRHKSEHLIERMAAVVRSWLREAEDV